MASELESESQLVLEATIVISATPAVPHSDLADESSIVAFWAQTAAIADVKLRKLIRDPTELLTRAVQPMLWLLVFGEVFTRIRARLMIQGGTSAFGLGTDFMVLGAVFAVFIAIAARLFPGIAQ